MSSRTAKPEPYVWSGVLTWLVSSSWVWQSTGAEQTAPNVLSLADAIAAVHNPGPGFGNQSPFELQVYYRLSTLRYKGYSFQRFDAGEWRRVMLNEKADRYARLCAAYFLLDTSDAARQFIERGLSSSDLRTRYNAAQIVQMHVGRDRSKAWGVGVLLRLLQDGSIDGSGVSYSPAGEYPRGDRDDIMSTPIDRICFDLGFMKEEKAVEPLIKVLERNPGMSGAAFALGEIGDPRAIPILMKLLANDAECSDDVVEAIGKLGHRPAVPILVERLGHPRSTFSGVHIVETEKLLVALRRINDKRAIEPIERYLDGQYPPRAKAVAKRVLVQLKENDPIPGLFALLDQERYEPEMADIIEDLCSHKDRKVVQRMAEIARASPSAFLRREAVCGLERMGTRDALLEVAEMLDLQFPSSLRAEWGWKDPPDFRRYFPELLQTVLERKTGQSFGNDREAWVKWISQHYQPANTPRSLEGKRELH